MSGHCAKCSKEANKKCQGCLDAPAYLTDNASPTYYCSRECQKVDFPKHKPRCKELQDRRMFDRAAGLLQTLWTILRARFYKSSVVKVNYPDTETLLVHGKTPDITKAYLFPPPRLPGSKAELDKLALMLDACTDVVVTMGPSIKHMLQGLLLVVKETSVVPMNQKLWSYSVAPDGGIPKLDAAGHQLFIVAFTDAKRPMISLERYALDLTHAQYGHHDETLMPWATYVDARCESTGKAEDVGHFAKYKLGSDYAKLFGDEEVGRFISNLMLKFRDAMTSIVREVGLQHGGWTKVLRLPDPIAYEKKAAQIAKTVTARLDGFVQRKKDDGLFVMKQSRIEARHVAAHTKDVEAKKIKSWGSDFRGQDFVDAMKGSRRNRRGTRRSEMSIQPL